MRRLLLIAILAGALGAEVVDSVVAVVGTHAIKHSDVLRELRLTAFLNQEPADTGPAARKQAVDRLIDQALIRQEMATGMSSPENPQQAEGLFRQLVESYGGRDAFQRALHAAGVEESALRRHLEWQSSVLQFIELRFGSNDPAEAPKSNDELFAWLDVMRKQERIEIREERLK